MNNGLYLSTSIDNSRPVPWLLQPNNAYMTTFTKPWTRNESDPYVYFGVYEATGTAAIQRKSYVTRVCKTESQVTKLNNFNSYLKMEVGCTLPPGSAYVTDQLTAAATSDGTPSTVYMAFTSADSTSPSSGGSAICVFSYTSEPYGIDYEMSGYIDYDAANSPFASYYGISGNPFTCMRNEKEGGSLYLVNPLSQDPGREVSYVVVQYNTSCPHLKRTRIQKSSMSYSIFKYIQ